MMQNKITYKLVTALVLSLLLSFTYLFLPSAFFSLDNRLRDFMFILRGELPKNDQIVIVDIDEKSLKSYGQWPWSRDTVTKLLNNITIHNPGIIGLDIVFAEPDRSSPHLLAKRFTQIPHDLPNNDALLAHTFQTSPIVGGYIFTFNDTVEEINAPMLPVIMVQKGLKDNHSILTPNNTILNIPILQNALYSSGFFNKIPEDNGMIHKVPLIMKYDNTIFTSLPLEMVRIYSNENRVDIFGDAFGLKQVSFGKYQIPVDNVGQLFVNFRGAKHHYTYISASDILDNKVKNEQLKNKFVLVGTSALGLYDLRAIAYDSNIPGVEIHANVIDNLLQGDFLSTPINHVLYNLLIIWIIIFIFMFLWGYVRSWLIIPFSAISLYLLSYIFFTLLFKYGLILNLLFPLLAFTLSLLFSIAIEYYTTYKQKEQTRKILGKKVSTSVMNHLLKHANEEIVASKEIEATIFFSDIQGFTAISEKIESPDRLIEMLNYYLTPMVESIISHHGTIDKFIGDAIMAYWNAPVKVPNHADQGVQSAIEQIESLQVLNQVINKKYAVNINIGIGLHTGLVTAGDMGAKGRSDYTVIGDNVNIASRLEGLTRYYDVQILISAATYRTLKGNYNIRPIDIVEVKGKSKPVEIFEVICNTKPITKEELSLYTKAITFFRDKKVLESYIHFSTLCEQYPSKLHTLYLNRCQNFIEHPEKTFTPILKMTTK